MKQFIIAISKSPKRHSIPNILLPIVISSVNWCESCRNENNFLNNEIRQTELLHSESETTMEYFFLTILNQKKEKNVNSNGPNISYSDMKTLGRYPSGMEKWKMIVIIRLPEQQQQQQHHC